MSGSYQGCYINNGYNRVNGHYYPKTFKQCSVLAASQNKPFFGMEYPQGYSVGYAECLLLSALPNMYKTSDTDCEREIADGKRLGSANRLAVYATTGSDVTSTTGPGGRK